MKEFIKLLLTSSDTAFLQTNLRRRIAADVPPRGFIWHRVWKFNQSFLMQTSYLLEVVRESYSETGRHFHI